MSLVTLRTRAREFLEDTNAASYRWSTALINQYLSDAADEFARDTRCYRKGPTTLTVSATTPVSAFYTLPSDFYELVNVNNNGIWLRPTPVSTLPNTWNADIGTPYGFVPIGEIGTTELRVYPYTVAALTALKIMYVALPTTMGSTDANNPTGIPVTYQNALVYWAVAKCWQRENEEGDQQKASMYLSMYQDLMRDCAASISRSLSASSPSVPYRSL